MLEFFCETGIVADLRSFLSLGEGKYCPERGSLNLLFFCSCATATEMRDKCRLEREILKVCWEIPETN